MNCAPANRGCVYIVGGGPGDPGLLTLKGAHLIAEADVILYDSLLDQRLLDLAGPDCERIHVGHRGGGGTQKQDDVNRLLVEHASRGRRVVRLKGGDPYIFGRGGEEALALRAAGIPFEVVSGVSAAAGVPAYAGIPLTHRSVSATAVLVTGHEDPSREQPAVDWKQLAQLDSTLVIFMGSRNLGDITAVLTEHGRLPETPAAAIEWGTWPEQRTVVSTLSRLAADAGQAGLQSPTLVVVGDVVNLRERLNWFEGKPLFGRRILVTRSREQAGGLQLMLEAEGAEVSVLPLLEISAPDDCGDLDAAIDELATFDWIVFTSPNSVDYFFSRLSETGRDARALSPGAVAAVGLATTEHLRDRGISPDLIPDEQTQSGLVAAFAHRDVTACRFLVPASSIGRTDLDRALAERGALIRRVVAYDNRPPDPTAVRFPAALLEDRIDLFVFASPSSVRNFFGLYGPERARRQLGRKEIACIGPTTASAARDLGLDVTLQPTESSIAALVTAICDFYGRERE